MSNVEISPRVPRQRVLRLRIPQPLRPPETLLSVLSILCGVLLPPLCFWLTLETVPNAPDWQSGEFYAYISFLLKPETSWVFFPFMGYAMACLIFFTIRPNHASRFSLVRFGIYSGVVLSLQFVWILNVTLLRLDGRTWISLGATTAGVVLLMLVELAAPLILWLLWVAAKVLFTTIRAKIPMWALIIGGVLLVAAPAAALIALEVATEENVIEELSMVVLAIAIFVPLFSAPAWSMAAYAYQSLRVIRLHGGRFQLRLWQFLIVFTWVSALLAAWRTAVILMLDAYAKLPVNPPERCYIATAAARGTPAVVRSREITYRDGSIGRVNRQLAYLKCGEVALLALAPTLHLLLRWLYDRAAPPVARRLRRPWLANLAYCGMKPLEWATRLALRALFGAAMHDYAKRLYGGE